MEVGSIKIILKLGGSVITKKYSERFPLDINEIKKRADEYIRIEDVRRLGVEIYEALQEKNIQLVLINGAGTFGHYLVRNWDVLDNKAMVHDSVKYLNRRLIEIMEECGLKIEPFAPFDSLRVEDRKYSVYKLWSEGKKIIGAGKIFSTYGDIVSDAASQYGYKVVSGDDIAVEIVRLWDPDKIIMTTDVDGVYYADPRIDKTAKLIKRLRGDEKVEFSDGRKMDVTGTMKGKVSKLLTTQMKSQIINGLVPDNVKSALLGDESIGTLILP